eukprot:TRINITY_DN308_c0_g1_i1.p1 TRINITY_DN308_c0_g1~~TRINITY_DN308_c0_g1_i1.p1  ORF type:complete len:669 (+),score=199.29 TRINITY_DN308_c0_g1_i1:81-2087(+)
MAGARAFALLLLVQGQDTLASRATIDVHDFQRILPMQFQSTSACATDRINQLVGSNKPENVPWNEVMPLADDFILAQTRDIEQLTQERDRLTALLQESQAWDAPDELNQEQCAGLVEQAMASVEGGTKNFGSSDIAKRTKCGGDMFSEESDAAMAEAGLELDDLLFFYDENSVVEQAFEAAFNAQMAGQKGVAFDPKVVTAACEQVLGIDAAAHEDDDNFCPRLCSKIVEKANSLSGGYKTRSDLVETRRQGLAQVENALKMAISSKNACEKKKAELEMLRNQLETLSKEAKAADTDRIQARIVVVGATKELKKYKAMVKDQEEVMQKLLLLLEQLGLNVVQSKKLLEDATAKRDKLDADTKDAEQHLHQIEDDINRMMNAIEAASNLRTKVVGLLLSMTVFFENMVQDPIRALGVTNESPVKQTFAERKSAELSSELSSILQDMSKFCGDQATLKDLSSGKVDGTSLCQLGSDATAIQTEIIDIVDKRQRVAETRFMQLQEDLAESSDKQPLTNLAQVFTLYSQTKFYREYLQKWELSGAFKDISKNMEQELLKLEEDEQKQQAVLAQLREQLVQAEAARDKAQQQLIEDQQKYEETKGKKLEEEKLLQSLREKADQAKAALKKFMANSRAVDQRMKAIRNKLIDTHTSHKEMASFLESIEKGTRLL